VVHGVVHHCGGHLLLDTELGRGTRVQLLFTPAAGELALPRPPPPAPRPAPAAARVLVVDDERAVAAYLRDLLEGEGYEVDMHTDPLGALAALRGDPDGYAAVVTDQTMPGLTGTELA